MATRSSSGSVAAPRAARGGPAVAATAFAWLLLYFVIVLTPLVVALTANPPPGRAFWLEFSVALGFVGLAMLGAQFAIVSRFSAVSAPYGLDVVLNFHRGISFVAFAFVLAHPAIIVIRNPDLLPLLNPVTAHWTARFGLISVAALIALIVTSVWRKRLRIGYEVWRVLHGLLAVTVVVAALVHIERVGYYVDGPWKRGLWIVMSAAFVVLLANVYFVEPLRQRNRPWEVVSVTPERGASWTLTIRPVGHRGIRFAPGQFAWIRVNRSPFAVREHPFSFSSSAEPHDDASADDHAGGDPPAREDAGFQGAVAFTIAEAGDFTSHLGELEPGDRVYLDGPYGVFTFERNEGPRFVFLAGGIGISPIMSMLRTLADRGDQRPCLLLYGNPGWHDVTFREELEQMCDRLDLTVVHVLEDPPEDWTGETGYIDDGVLERHLGDHPERARYFLCGPPPMMDAVLGALTLRGIPDRHIDLEIFDLV